MIPDRWLKVVAHLPETIEPGIAAALFVERGARSVVEEADTLVTFFTPPDDPETFSMRLAEDLRRLDVGDVEVNWSWQPHEAWSELWKQGLGARRIGARLLVVPTWVDVEEPAGREVIRIDPGVAFGTAEHASTRVCLTYLEDVVAGGETVLDVGSGSGILSIAAVRLGAASALGVEIDSMACTAAVENVERNEVGSLVRIEERALGIGPSFGLGRFRIVVANMVCGLLTPRLLGLADAMEDGGTLIVGGVQIEERSQFVADASASGLQLMEGRAEDGWWGGRFRGAVSSS